MCRSYVCEVTSSYCLEMSAFWTLIHHAFDAYICIHFIYNHEIMMCCYMEELKKLEFIYKLSHGLHKVR